MAAVPVKVVVGDLFQSKAQTLVNPVNCVGVMGKGVALEFKRRFPEMYGDYVARCRRKHVKLGQPYLYRYPNPPLVLNFPTKDHWRNVSRIKDIVCGMEYLLAQYKEWGITSLAVPFPFSWPFVPDRLRGQFPARRFLLHRGRFH